MEVVAQENQDSHEPEDVVELGSERINDVEGS